MLLVRRPHLFLLAADFFLSTVLVSLGPATSPYVFPLSYPVSGIESGGHGSASAPSVLNLVPQIMSALPPSGVLGELEAGGPSPSSDADSTPF